MPPRHACPEIRDALVHFLAGSDDLTRLRTLVDGDSDILARGIMGFQATVAGSALDRLCALALELGLVHDGSTTRVRAIRFAGARSLPGWPS